MPDSADGDIVGIVSDSACDLGEGIVWDRDRSRVYWVDITGRAVFSKDWDTGVIKSLAFPEMVGSVGLRASGGLVAALEHSLVFCDLDAGTIDPPIEVDDEPRTNRFNDGAVDPGGRFWFGSSDREERVPSGAFYRLGEDGSVTRAFGDIICHNGPAWSPDGRTLYHVDSAKDRITAYEFDVEAGVVGGGRLFASDEHEAGSPDGVTVDAEGFVWSCKWDGGRVVRYDPDGKTERVLTVPVPRPTRCAFVGPDMDLIAISSARYGLSDLQLAQAPLSGHVLLFDSPVRGLPTPTYRG